MTTTDNGTTRWPGAFRVHEPMTQTEAEALATDINAGLPLSPAFAQQSENQRGTWLVYLWTPDCDYPTKILSRAHWQEFAA